MAEKKRRRKPVKPETDERKMKVLEAAQECGFDRNISKICKDAGLQRRATWDDWYKNDPKFKKAWDNLPHKMVGRFMPGVVAAQVQKALSGDTQAARLVMEFCYKSDLARAAGGGDVNNVFQQNVLIQVMADDQTRELLCRISERADSLSRDAGEPGRNGNGRHLETPPALGSPE